MSEHTTPRCARKMDLPVEHYENFPVASILMPRRLRKPVAAIYHFAREADDIADEGDFLNRRSSCHKPCKVTIEGKSRFCFGVEFAAHAGACDGKADDDALAGCGVAGSVEKG